MLQQTKPNCASKESSMIRDSGHANLKLNNFINHEAQRYFLCSKSFRSEVRLSRALQPVSERVAGELTENKRKLIVSRESGHFR